MMIFYRPEQAAPNLGTISPSASKPQLVMDDWRHLGVLTADNVRSFAPLTRDDFKRVHHPQMVDDVLDLKRRNGFRNTDAAIAASLPYTSGSMLAAARWALQNCRSACSPTSGFHHAHFDEPEGYCTFNGLMVTAVKLLDEGLVRTVAILDCDVHEGNGTEDIINRLGLQPQIQHHSMGGHFQTREQVGTDAAHFKTWLQQALTQCMQADLVLYQASADPHMDDPLGGVLTGREMLERDNAVFRTLKHMPLVWNLAGGYQRDAAGSIEPVLQRHRMTLLSWLGVCASEAAVGVCASQPVGSNSPALPWAHGPVCAWLGDLPAEHASTQAERVLSACAVLSKESEATGSHLILGPVQLLQRRLKLGYTLTLALIQQLQALGVLSPGVQMPDLDCKTEGDAGGGTK